MGFVKVIKNKAYFKRLQVQKRRRREGKTDYGARRLMVKQDKNKYNTPKYRLIVRCTNTRIICQVAYATIAGDTMMCSADSTELPRYGIKVGLKNFAASYATGLLCARRLLNKVGMEEAFTGVEEADGEEFHIEEEEESEERRPFKAILDIGLARATVGAKIFAAMKGAADGGLHVPHNNKRFPGYRAPEDKGADEEFDASALRDRIYGAHVSEYMESMEEEDEQKYQAHFAKYIEHGIGADDVEDMYKEGHKAIRENPAFEKKEREEKKWVRTGNKITNGDVELNRKVKKSKKERMGRVAQIIAAAQHRLLNA